MTDKSKKASRSLPLGEERDGLRDNADKILSGGRARPLPMDDDDIPLRRRPSWDDDESYDLTPLNAAARKLDTSEARRRRLDDERIAQERAAYKPSNPFGRGREIDPNASHQGGGWGDPFVKFGGITMTKRQFMDAINNDLPRLVQEAMDERTLRGKLLRSTLIPMLRSFDLTGEK